MAKQTSWYDLMAAKIKEEMAWAKAYHRKMILDQAHARLLPIINEPKFKRA
jgi:hypothetical protein